LSAASKACQQLVTHVSLLAEDANVAAGAAGATTCALTNDAFKIPSDLLN
jgi:hypothetical protein